jgi:DNA-binding LacI/PurR family transcriptional regulator
VRLLLRRHLHDQGRHREDGATGDPARLKEERLRIRDYLNALKDYDTRLWGKISVLPDGSSTVPIYFMQIKNNRPVLVTTSRDWKPKR